MIVNKDIIAALTLCAKAKKTTEKDITDLQIEEIMEMSGEKIAAIKGLVSLQKAVRNKTLFSSLFTESTKKSEHKPPQNEEGV